MAEPPRCWSCRVPSLLELSRPKARAGRRRPSNSGAHGSAGDTPRTLD